ncbi:Hypothetical protein POVR1_LOCUS10 [uncultured virus]|nr:Hypothetical protein POVR1_LOCUS10 [uncultured virus]
MFACEHIVMKEVISSEIKALTIKSLVQGEIPYADCLDAAFNITITLRAMNEVDFQFFSMSPHISNSEYLSTIMIPSIAGILEAGLNIKLGEEEYEVVD